MSDPVVLIVEKNDRIRAAINNGLRSRFVRTLDVAHAFDAMSSLGRAEFGAVIITPGKRQLSLRGLLSLARRRHPGVHLFVIVDAGTSIAQLEEKIGVKGVRPIDPSTTVEQLSGLVVDALAAPYSPDGVDAPSSPLEPLSLEDGFDVAVTPVKPRVALTAKPPAEPPIPVEITPPGSTPVPAAAASAPARDAADARSATPRAGATARPPEAPVHMGSAPVPVSMTLPSLPSSAEGAATEDTASENAAPRAAAPAPVEMPTPSPAPPKQAEVPSNGNVAPAAQADGSGKSPAPMGEPPPAWSAPAAWSVPAATAGSSASEDTFEFEADFPLLEGTLDGRAGPALLLSIAAQELSGALHVDAGEAKGRIYLHRGEPVWATPKDGDAGLFALLKDAGKLQSNAELPELADGQLFAHLSAAGLLESEGLYQFMLDFVRDRVLKLIDEEQASYAFYEDTTFETVAPLLTVNPFGMVFESKRRSVSPDRLLAVGGEIEWKYLHPLPALAPAAERIKPFARGVDISSYINGVRTMRAFCSHTGLDVVMGTLMILALEEARLVTVEDKARDIEKGSVELSSTTGVHMKAPSLAKGGADPL